MSFASLFSVGGYAIAARIFKKVGVQRGFDVGVGLSILNQVPIYLRISIARRFEGLNKPFRPQLGTAFTYVSIAARRVG